MESNPIMLAQTLPVLEPINWSVFINGDILTIVLLVFFVVYVVISGVLMYHWSAYGMGSLGVVISETVFILVSIVLFVIAGLSIYYF